MDEIELIKTNILEDNDASFAPFGYAFQADAGLYLFCRFYRTVQSIKIESALQDIEILDKNNKYIMAQAKASQNPFNCDNYGSKLFNALFSLARHYVNEDDKLIYVTNIPNVFGKEMNGQFDNEIVPYSQLSQNAKNIVLEKIKSITQKVEQEIDSNKASEKQIDKLKLILKKLKKFNLNNLSFLSINRYFEGGDKSTIKERIASFLHNDLEINDSNRIASITDDLFNIWHDMFYLDSELSSKNSAKTITKDQFCWPIITISSLRHSTSEIAEYLDGGYDEVMGSEIEFLVKKFKDNYDYELMNKILNGYYSYIPTDRRDKKKEFILQKWEEYSKYFKCDDKKIEKASTMFFLFCTLSDYVTVSKVLRGKDL